MGKVKKAKKEKGNDKAEVIPLISLTHDDSYRADNEPEQAKAQKKAKAEKKAGKKGTKQAKKGKNDDDMDEDDLIRTLEEYRQAWADEHKVTGEFCILARREDDVDEA